MRVAAKATARVRPSWLVRFCSLVAIAAERFRLTAGRDKKFVREGPVRACKLLPLHALLVNWSPCLLAFAFSRSQLSSIRAGFAHLVHIQRISTGFHFIRYEQEVRVSIPFIGKP